MDKKMILLNIGISCVVALGVVFLYDKYYKKPSYVTVDLDGIVNSQKESYRERLMNAQSPQEMASLQNESANFVNSLYESVQAYSKNNNVVIFQSSALIAGETRDITKEVVEAYKVDIGQ